MIPVLDLSSLHGWLLYLTAVLGAFAAALWLGLVFWTYRDARARTHDRLVHILAALLVAALNVPGVLIYLILRPPRSLDEEYQRTLEEEALLSEIEDRPVCPGCSARVRRDWQVCPACLTKLRKPCLACGRMMELPWKVCAFCGTPVPGARGEPSAAEEPAPISD
jgi:hypothetical protein